MDRKQPAVEVFQRPTEVAVTFRYRTVSLGQTRRRFRMSHRRARPKTSHSRKDVADELRGEGGFCLLAARVTGSDVTSY